MWKGDGKLAKAALACAHWDTSLFCPGAENSCLGWQRSRILPTNFLPKREAALSGCAGSMQKTLTSKEAERCVAQGHASGGCDEHQDSTSLTLSPATAGCQLDPCTSPGKSRVTNSKESLLVIASYFAPFTSCTSGYYSEPPRHPNV